MPYGKMVPSSFFFEKQGRGMEREEERILSHGLRKSHCDKCSHNESNVFRAQKSMYHALGYSAVVFIKATMTCDRVSRSIS